MALYSDGPLANSDIEKSTVPILQVSKAQEADPYLSKTDSGEFLSECLGSLQGFLVAEHRNAHHGSFNVGAGHHQDLPQSTRQRMKMKEERIRRQK